MEDRRLPRPRAGRAVARAGRRHGRGLRRDARPRRRAARRRADRVGEEPGARRQRAGRPDRPARRRGGRRRLQDRPQPAVAGRRARLAGPGAVRPGLRPHAASRVRVRRAAPPAERAGAPVGAQPRRGWPATCGGPRRWGRRRPRPPRRWPRAGTPTRCSRPGPGGSAAGATWCGCARRGGRRCVCRSSPGQGWRSDRTSTSGDDRDRAAQHDRQHRRADRTAGVDQRQGRHLHRVGHPRDEPAVRGLRRGQPRPGLPRLRLPARAQGGGEGGHRRRRQPVRRHLGRAGLPAGPGRQGRPDLPRLGRRPGDRGLRHLRLDRGHDRDAARDGRPGRRGDRLRARSTRTTGPTRCCRARRRAT